MAAAEFLAALRRGAFYGSSVLLAAVLLTGRLVLWSSGSGLLLRGLAAELAMAVCLVLLAWLLRRLHLAACAGFLLAACALQLANLEMAVALDTFLCFPDLRFAADGRFLRGSLHMSFPGYALVLLGAVLLFLAAADLVGRKPPPALRLLLPPLLVSILAVHLLSWGEGTWRSGSLLWLSLTRSFRGAPAAAGRGPLRGIAPGQAPPGFYPGTEEGLAYFRQAEGARRNVLLVVLEGIPGVYLRQVQEHTGVRYPIQMPNLSRIAQRSLVVPNFLTHNRQTIRGMYSLLAGDYSKLSLTTPKIYEYLSLSPAARDPCLPAILASRGYTTAYLQAADLAYMSKDRFMPAAGFQQVLGREFFRYQHVPFGWGPDDKAFFEQAADFIVALQAKGSPWLVTLLTVGTHHPGAVPEQFASRFGSRREAAVAWLDEAVGELYERLRSEGVLDDTLLFITSDESHGVSGHPLGRFWGLAVAHAPESRGALNPGVFGLLDVPRSLLDYLRLPPPARPARSLFRRYETERPILFEEFYSGRKDSITRRLDDGRVEVLRSRNGELFAAAYSRQVIAGQEGRAQARKLASWQSAADSSLVGQTARRRRYELLRDNSFELPARGVRVLSTGQYLDIPAGTRVTVELEAAVPLGAARLALHMMQEAERMPLPKLDLPVLLAGQTLSLSFSFHAAQPLQRIWAYLQASAGGAGTPARLEVRSFTVSMRPAGRGGDFRLHRLRVR